MSAPKHAARAGHEAKDAKPTFGELFSDRLHVLEADGYLDSRPVPVDGKRLHVPVESDYALTRPTDSHDGNVRVRLAALVTTQSGSVLSVGQARVRNPLARDSRVVFFVSEPPKPGGNRAKLIGVVDSGFPVTATEERAGVHGSTEQLWNLTFGESREGNLTVSEVSAEEGSPAAKVFIAKGPWLADNDPMPDAFWAPDPNEIARTARHQSSSVGETALIAAVKEDTDATAVLPRDALDATVVLSPDELDRTVVLHRLPV